MKTRRRTGKRRFRRTLKGGKREARKYRPPGGVPEWPKLDGCLLLRIDKVALPIGTILDRIGSQQGKFVAVVQADIDTGVAMAPSYVSRSLRLLGETPYEYPFSDAVPEKDKVDLRELLYREIYNNENDPDNNLYYVLKVTRKFYGKNPCKAANAFGYPGGALQMELPDTVENLIKNGSLEKFTPAATVALLGRSHPPYKKVEDYMADKDSYFRPYSTALYTVMNSYYTTKEERENFRKSRGQIPTPHPTTPGAAIYQLPATIRPSPAPSSPLGVAGSLSSPKPRWGSASQFTSPTAVKSLASRFNSSITPSSGSAVGVVSP